jgi:hypothetical protein
VDQVTILAGIVSGDRLRLSSVNNPTLYNEYTVVTTVNNTTYFTFIVTWFGGQDTLFENGEAVDLNILEIGATGVQGYQGAQGAVGTTVHSALTALDYASSGHTGFAGLAAVNAFTAGQRVTGDVQVTGSVYLSGNIKSVNGIVPTATGWTPFGVTIACGYYAVAGVGTIAAQNIPNTNVVGLYRVSAYMMCVGAGTGTWTITWGWSDGRGARTMTDTFVLSAGNKQGLTRNFQAGSSSAYLTFTVTNSGTGNGDFYLACERFG